MSQSQLRQLAEPFKGNLVRQPAPGKHGTYVKHSTITERLLSIVGPFDFAVEQVIRGDAPEIVTKGQNPRTYPARTNAVVAVVARLTCTIDGRVTSVAEVGSEDNPAMGHDGDNLKNAASDALKRCAMRIGSGLHLWSVADGKSLYFLAAQLDHDAKVSTGGGEPSAAREDADQDTPTQRGLLDE